MQPEVWKVKRRTARMQATERRKVRTWAPELAAALAQEWRAPEWAVALAREWRAPEWAAALAREWRAPEWAAALAQEAATLAAMAAVATQVEASTQKVVPAAALYL